MAEVLYQADSEWFLLLKYENVLPSFVLYRWKLFSFGLLAEQTNQL